MADHYLTRIRQAMFDRLSGISAGYGVYKGRRRRWPLNLLPALNITMLREEIEPTNLHDNPLMKREGSIVVEIVVASNDDIEPTIFEIQKDVEALIDAESTLDGTCNLIYLSESEPEEMEPDLDLSELEVEKRLLTFSFMTYTLSGQPECIVGIQ